MTSQEDVKKVEYLLKLFNTYTWDIDRIRRDGIYDKKDYMNKKEYIEYIKSVLNRVSFNSYRVLLNEFILGRTGNWYEGYCCKSTYYLHRAKAIEEFLRCLGY